MKCGIRQPVKFQQSVWMLLRLGFLYKPVQTVSPEETPTRDFLKLDFRNKGLDAVKIGNILNHKKVTSTIPAYLKKQSPPIISYSYSSPIAPKIFNYQNVLQGVNTENTTRTLSVFL